MLLEYIVNDSPHHCLYLELLPTPDMMKNLIYEIFTVAVLRFVSKQGHQLIYCILQHASWIKRRDLLLSVLVV